MEQADDRIYDVPSRKYLYATIKSQEHKKRILSQGQTRSKNIVRMSIMPRRCCRNDWKIFWQLSKVFDEKWKGAPFFRRRKPVFSNLPARACKQWSARVRFQRSSRKIWLTFWKTSFRRQWQQIMAFESPQISHQLLDIFFIPLATYFLWRNEIRILISCQNGSEKPDFRSFFSIVATKHHYNESLRPFCPRRGMWGADLMSYEHFCILGLASIAIFHFQKCLFMMRKKSVFPNAVMRLSPILIQRI